MEMHKYPSQPFQVAPNTFALLRKSHSPAKVEWMKSLTELYVEHPWHDQWRDSAIADAIHYVRASKKLRLPDEWRKVFASEIPNDSDSEE